MTGSPVGTKTDDHIASPARAEATWSKVLPSQETADAMACGPSVLTSASSGEERLLPSDTMSITGLHKPVFRPLLRGAWLQQMGVADTRSLTATQPAWGCPVRAAEQMAMSNSSTSASSHSNSSLYSLTTSSPRSIE